MLNNIFIIGFTVCITFAVSFLVFGMMTEGGLQKATTTTWVVVSITVIISGLVSLAAAIYATDPDDPYDDF